MDPVTGSIVSAGIGAVGRVATPAPAISTAGDVWQTLGLDHSGFVVNFGDGASVGGNSPPLAVKWWWFAAAAAWYVLKK